MTTDEYPDDDELDKIQYWPHGTHRELMAFVRGIWWRPNWGWKEKDVVDEDTGDQKKRYEISTGGWSGNESIIGALQKNWLFWATCWLQSSRGGHYVFEVAADELKGD